MPTSDWAPSSNDVAGLLRARTLDTQGQQLGVFGGDTKPTDVQVAALVDDGVADVFAATGDVPELLWPTAKRVAAIGTAMLVELSYFPEQIGTDASIYDRLKALYDERLKTLVKQVADLTDDGTLGEGGSGMPSYAFPDDNGGLVGWGTRW